MMAGTFATFTLEAFLNHLGRKKVRDWEAFERKLGPKAKLLLIKQVVGLPIDFSQRPYQTIGEMLSLRNAIAHGKTTTTTQTELVGDDEKDWWPEPDWKELCGRQSVTRMIEDAEEIVRELHLRAGLGKLDPFASPGHAWSGPARKSRNTG